MDEEERASAIRRGILDPSETISEDGNRFRIDHTVIRRDVAPTTEEQLWTRRIHDSISHSHRQAQLTFKLAFLCLCALGGIVAALIGAFAHP